jgi:hypothetical protein
MCDTVKTFNDICWSDSLAMTLRSVLIVYTNVIRRIRSTGYAWSSSGRSTVNSWNPSSEQEFATDEEREWPEVDFENLEDSSQPRDKSTDTETVGPPPPLSLAEVERQLPASPDEARHNSPTEASEGHSVLTSTLSPSLFKFNSPDFVPPSDFLSSFLSPVDVVEPPPEFADTNANPSSSSPSAVADPVVGVMPVIASFLCEHFRWKDRNRSWTGLWQPQFT